MLDKIIGGTEQLKDLKRRNIMRYRENIRIGEDRNGQQGTIIMVNTSKNDFLFFFLISRNTRSERIIEI